MPRTVLLAVGSVLLAACNGTGSTSHPERAGAPSATQEGTAARATAERSYVLVLLRTGPKDGEVQGEARDAAFRGHFENMQRLAEAGRLLVAGPFAKPKTDSTLRGLFLFDVAEVEDALELASGDPTLQRSILIADPRPCTSADPLRRSLELEEQAEARGEEPALETYVLAIAEPSEAGVADEAARDERVLFALRCTGAHAGERVLLLDAREPESALELLESHGAEPSRWALHPWMSTALLQELR